MDLKSREAFFPQLIENQAFSRFNMWLFLPEKLFVPGCWDTSSVMQLILCICHQINVR